MKFDITIAVETSEKAEPKVRASIDAALAEVVRGVALTTIEVVDRESEEVAVDESPDSGKLDRTELEALAKSLNIKVTARWKDETILKKINEAKAA